jgi:hypothetical protein
VLLFCHLFLVARRSGPFPCSFFFLLRSPQVRSHTGFLHGVLSGRFLRTSTVQPGVLDLWLCSFCSALVRPPPRFFGSLLSFSFLRLESDTHPRIWRSWCLLLAVLFWSPTFLHRSSILCCAALIFGFGAAGVSC